MKAEELMIGDWVLKDMNYSEEDPMYTRPDYQPYQIQNGEDIDLACETNCIGDADVYLPIPLTTEILKKLGFTPRRVAGWEDRDLYFWEGDNAYVRLVPLSYKNSSWYDLKIESIDSDDLRRGDLRRTMVKYVHEMQQAFRLNGINKELNLIKKN